MLGAADREQKVAEWVEGYAKFLYCSDERNADEDFVIKSHATVKHSLVEQCRCQMANIYLQNVLLNLANGPYDEDCSQLFAPSSWIF